MLTGHRNRRGCGSKIGLPLACIALVCTIPDVAVGQEDSGEGRRTLTGFQPRSAMRQSDDPDENPARRLHMQERGPRPSAEVKQFLSVGSTDGIVEVIVGQGKLLTLKQDLVAAGDNVVPLIAVGDPTVIDFEVLDNRHIRITGLRIGVTDFAILTSDGDDYTFEVQVTADMEILEDRLHQVFPEAADVRVRQLRDHVVLEGTVPSADLVASINDMVTGYLQSVSAGQMTKIKSKQRDTIRDVPSERPNSGNTGENSPGYTDLDSSKPDIEYEIPEPKVINLLKIERESVSVDGTNSGPEDESVELGPTVQSSLAATLRSQFPGAAINLRWVGESHVVVSGQARDALQLQQILDFVGNVAQQVVQEEDRLREYGRLRQEREDNLNAPPPPNGGPVPDISRSRDNLQNRRSVQVINLMTVPGPQQVMLKVQVAELNRTAFRAIGLNFLVQDGGTTIGTRVGGRVASFTQLFLPTGVPQTTVFGLFDNGDFQFILDALRQNNVLKILAEPNLVAMNGHEASFLAGGEFPVPVPQSGAGGGIPTITIQYKQFGVQLDFTPTIHDHERLQLSVAPEVSSIDQSLGIELQGFRIPALSTRRAATTVEMREGQTLAIAGLLQIEMAGNTARIPGLGDLDYIGPFFSNTSSQTVEKELVVLITPHIVDAMEESELVARPGDLVAEPTDFELYLMGRIERRKCKDYRATTAWDDPIHKRQYMCLESDYVVGPHGYSN